MASRRVLRLAGIVLVCAIAQPALVAGDGRKNPRDFPDFTLCPINLGWFVDPVTGVIVPPPAQPMRAPALTFTATRRQATVRLTACDRGLTNNHPDGMELWIRDFAVVRQNVHETHQVASTYPDFTCYLPHDDEFLTPFARTIGSTFDPTVAPAVLPNTLGLPFRDDFSDLTFSEARWSLDGAAFQTVPMNDPRQPGQEGTALVLARVPGDPAQDSCSTASVKVRYLRPGQTYVIDFLWEIRNMVSAGEIDMLTFVDTTP